MFASNFRQVIKGMALSATLCSSVAFADTTNGSTSMQMDMDTTHKTHVGMGATTAPKIGNAEIIGARFLDAQGKIRRLGDDDGPGPVALVFVREHCPISKRYLPKLNEFATLAKENGVDFYAVLSSPRKNWDDAKELKKKLNLNFPVLFDASGDLAIRMGATMTPEAFVVNAEDKMIYRGRLDDRFAGIGQLRRVIKNHDLKNVIAQSNDKDFSPYSAPPIGCFLESWDKHNQNDISYERDIKPILAANCVECHQDGGVAPFALETYDQAMDRSGMMAYVTAEGIMPPWRPEMAYGRFRDERYLSKTQIALFTAWSEAGELEGTPADTAPSLVKKSAEWRLGKPDLVLPMTEPFPVPATGEDVYRYLVIPSGLVEDKTVIGIDFKPGDPTVVHHANFFVDYAGKARRLDAEDPLPGFSVFGTGGFMSYDDADAAGFGIGGWAPGAEPYKLPADTGLWMPSNGDIVIEIHYKLSGLATQDRSSIAFYFADEPTSEYIDGLLIGTQELSIPAGDKNYTRHISMSVPEGFKLVDMMPHMHYIGSKVHMQVTLPDGTNKTLFRINDWDIRWQNIYMLREPMHIPAGSRLDAWFVWDNSDDNFDNPFSPPQHIKWGWKSEEEMAEIWLGVLPDNPEKRDKLIDAAYQSWVKTDSRPIPD